MGEREQGERERTGERIGGGREKVKEGLASIYSRV